jgi:hypothetical protein
MAKSKSDFDNFDTPYEVQPPAGAAEGPIEYGAVVGPAAKGNFRDPTGVLPVEAKNKNLGPAGGEG